VKREYLHEPYIIARNYRVIGLNLRLAVYVYLHTDFRGGLRKRTHFETECVMTVQGHRRSLILAPIEIPLHWIANVGAPRSEDSFNFEVTQFIWPRYLNVTDGRTDRGMTYCSYTARSKNPQHQKTWSAYLCSWFIFVVPNGFQNHTSRPMSQYLERLGLDLVSDLQRLVSVSSRTKCPTSRSRFGSRTYASRVSSRSRPERSRAHPYTFHNY